MSDTARGGFANHFGPRAPLYRAARPTYPPALFHFLVLVPPFSRRYLAGLLAQHNYFR